MGSAVLCPTGYDLFRSMLDEMNQESRRAIAAGGEPDSRILLQIADAHLDCPEREAIRLYLVAYIARCLSGSVPDHTRWEPLN